MSTIDRHKLDRPCPPWCGLPTGHVWDDVTINDAGVIDGVLRYHETVSASEPQWSVAVSRAEVATSENVVDVDGHMREEIPDAGPGVLEPAVICVDTSMLATITAADARRIAAGLLYAADTADELNG